MKLVIYPDLTYIIIIVKFGLLRNAYHREILHKLRAFAPQDDCLCEG